MEIPILGTPRPTSPSFKSPPVDYRYHMQQRQKTRQCAYTACLYVLYMIATCNTDYFPKHRYILGLFSGHAAWFLWGRN
jgi:hypothetical protein